MLPSIMQNPYSPNLVNYLQSGSQCQATRMTEKVLLALQKGALSRSPFYKDFIGNTHINYAPIAKSKVGCILQVV